MQVHIELFGKLHNINVKEDMPSENKRNATLNRKTDRLGYVKHSIEVKKHMTTDRVAKVIEVICSIITSEVAKWISGILASSGDSAKCALVVQQHCERFTNCVTSDFTEKNKLGLRRRSSGRKERIGRKQRGVVFCQITLAGKNGDVVLIDE